MLTGPGCSNVWYDLGHPVKDAAHPYLSTLKRNEVTNLVAWKGFLP